MRRSLLHPTRSSMAIIAATIVLAIVGCTAPEATPSPSPSVVPTPTPEPTAVPVDPYAAVVGLVIRPMTLELRDDAGGVVAALDYAAPAPDAIAVLTDLFDTAPVDEPYEGTNHTPPGVTHTWDGLVIDERFYDEERRDGTALDYVWPRFAAYLDGPTVHGLDLSSEQGFHATDPWSNLSGDPVFDAQLWTCVGTPIETLGFSRPDGQAETATVVAMATEDGQSVKWLGAPVMLADGCT
jgi:hypothetical protein